MSSYLAIDGGTTNTRIYYVRDRSILAVEKIHAGVRAASDDPHIFINALKQGIETLQLRFGPASAVLIAGMLTSEMGLHEVAHVAAPAGIAELHSAMETVNMPELTPLPLSFIPGIKYIANDLSGTDMMRGEECELIGLSDNLTENTAYILPGSHSKVIFTDSFGRISSFYTQLSGEMAAALSESTILKTSVDLDQPLNHESLLIGYRYTEDNGINEALFKVRVLKNIFKRTADEVTSFYLGAILHGEVKRIIRSNPSRIIIGGQKHLKQALSSLLESLISVTVEVVPEATVSQAVVNGMVKIFEYRS